MGKSEMIGSCGGLLRTTWNFFFEELLRVPASGFVGPFQRPCIEIVNRTERK